MRGDDSDERGIILGGEALSGSEDVELFGGGGHGNGDARALRGGGDDTHVLDEDIESRAHLGIGTLPGFDRAGPAVAEHEGLGGAGHERVEDHPLIESESSGEGERLSGGGDVDAAQELVDGLHRLPLAGGVADEDEGSGHRVEDGPRDFPDLRGRAAGDEEVALPGSDRAAGDGCVDEADARLGEAIGLGLDGLGADGGGEDDRGSGSEDRDDAGGPVEDLLELGGVAHGDEDEVRAGGGRGGGVGDGDAALGGEGAALLEGVESGDLEGLGEMGGHGQSHRSETEDGDSLRHGCSLL